VSAPITQPAVRPIVFWRVQKYGQITVPPTRRHWWNNLDRDPPEVLTFQVVLGGDLRFHESGRRHVLNPGDAFLFGHGETSEYGLPDQRSYAYTCQWVCIEGAGLAEHWKKYRRQFGSVIRHATRRRGYRRMLALIEMSEAKVPSTAPVMARAVHDFVMTLFEDAIDHESAQRPGVEQAIDRLLQHPNSRWSLKTLADTHGITREHLTRQFTEQVGMSPGRYLTRLRTEQALVLLRETELPLEAVARQSGFPNARAMAVHLKRHLGTTPGAWRSELGGEGEKE